MHLLHARRDLDRHGAGAVERDDEREAELAHFLAHLERNGQHFVERRAVVPAQTEARAAAGDEQTAAAFAHELAQRRQPRAAERLGGNVFEDHRARAAEREALQARRVRRDDLDGNRRLAQRGAERVLGAVLIHDQHRPLSVHTQRGERAVVLGRGVGGADDAQPHLRDPGLGDEVAEGPALHAGLECAHAARELFAVAFEHVLDLARRIGANPGVDREGLEHARFQRSVETLDRHVAAHGPHLREHVDAHAARKRGARRGERIAAVRFAVRHEQQPARAIRGNQREAEFER